LYNSPKRREIKKLPTMAVAARVVDQAVVE
jgi:hypothetical protein